MHTQQQINFIVKQLTAKTFPFVTVYDNEISTGELKIVQLKKKYVDGQWWVADVEIFRNTTPFKDLENYHKVDVFLMACDIFRRLSVYYNMLKIRVCYKGEFLGDVYSILYDYHKGLPYEKPPN